MCFEEYEAADREVKQMIRNAKRNFEKRLAVGNGGNSRPFYAYIKRKTKSRPGIGPLKNKKKETITDNQGMAELLNNFFGSVFTREDPENITREDAENITREDAENIPVAEEMEGRTLDSITITEKAVREKVKNLKTDSAAGPDEIGPKLLQELESVLTRPLTWIFRESINSGEVPAEWRSANVTPIFKKGPKSDLGNYCPVSLTSVCCKLLESILRDALMSHLTANSLLNQSQHGFMPGKSCTTNLLEFMEKTTKVINAGLPFDIVFLDFAKAFDKVPREQLLEKL
jgi:hypothetical protein